MPQPLQLDTPRLALRPPRTSDFAAIHASAADADVIQFMDWGPNDEEATRAFLTASEAGALNDVPSPWDFVVVEKSSSRLVGVAGIRLLPPARAEIGYWLAREAWGRGLATEAALELTRLGFESLKAHRVEARCDPENYQSARVMQKCGMRYEGCLRQSVFVRGQWKDRNIYSVLEQEWAP